MSTHCSRMLAVQLYTSSLWESIQCDLCENAELYITLQPDITESVLQTSTTEPEYQPVEPCRSPLPPNNGSVSVWGKNLLVEYACDEGLFPVGRIFGSCNPSTKRWSIRRPLCVSSDCDRPENITNGQLYFEQQGSIVIAMCRRGYRLTGSRERYCDGYIWRGYPPKCRDMFPSRGPRQQNDTVPTVATSQAVSQDFLEEHILDSDNSCYVDFSEPPAVKYATFEIVYKYNKVRKQWILIANYTCEMGYIFNETKATYLYCKNYKWVGEKVPECVNTVLPAADPCMNANGGCEHTCISYEGGWYQCQCRPGYILGRSKKTCHDIDECRFDNGGCEHSCINMIGSFFCTCETGYVSTGLTCSDVDECSTPGGHRCIGECINIPGSYECNCTKEGFTEAVDKKSCVDFDECQENNGACQEVCINTVGSYRCGCLKKGNKVSKDGHTCVDIDECISYKKKRCLHGVCENLPGSYICQCDAGFEASSSGKRCIDRNECKEDNGECTELCENNVGSYTCGCYGDGYVIGNDGKTCLDANECEIGNGNCEDVCINTPGSYKCGCLRELEALHEDGHSCTTCDRDHFFDRQTRTCAPCPNNTAVNETVAVATKLEECNCKTGFVSLNDSLGNCIDVNECEEGLLLCDQVCINTPGSAYCECEPGYNLSRHNKCIDIDECLSGPCSQHCHNIAGTYRCTCYDGYDLAADQHNCIDVEECLDEILLCEQVCINTVGDAYCSCENGFEINEDNVTCKDIDECSRGTHLCEDKCVNTEGSYTCDCLSRGLKLSWDLASCSDINECMEGENNCTGICVNMFGSYTCKCYEKGYVTSQDGTTCEDQDECSSPELNDCLETCVNTEGSYRCDCFLGHALIGYNKCAPCPRNYFRDEDSVECVSCPSNSVTVTNGSIGIEDCICEDGLVGNVTIGEECIKKSE